MDSLDLKTANLLKEVQEFYPNIVIKHINENQIKIYDNEKDMFTINGQNSDLVNGLLYSFLMGFKYSYKQLFVNNND